MNVYKRLAEIEEADDLRHVLICVRSCGDCNRPQATVCPGTLNGQHSWDDGEERDITDELLALVRATERYVVSRYNGYAAEMKNALEDLGGKMK